MSRNVIMSGDLEIHVNPKTDEITLSCGDNSLLAATSISELCDLIRDLQCAADQARRNRRARRSGRSEQA